MSASTKIIQAAAGVDTGREPAGSAYDISTAQWLGENGSFFSVRAEDTQPLGMTFKTDGKKLYVVGVENGSVHEYNLFNAWDISSGSFVQSFSVSSQETTPDGIFFKPDGTKMYVIGSASDAVQEYNLSTAWDISSASYLQNFSVSSQDLTPRGVFFKPDGAKMYVAGNQFEKVYEYDLSTAWDVTSASFLQDFSVSSQVADATDLFFKPDGAKMYVVDRGGNDVNEYDLSTAWDVTSASFVQNFSVSSREADPFGLTFKSDGTVMYIVGPTSSDGCSQYGLSTAWDISSAALTEPTLLYFDASAQETAVSDVFLKPDGSKMYIVGTSSDAVQEYDLSTAWDISTGSFNQSFSVSAQEIVPTGLSFKSDGTKMYVCGVSGDDVNEYNLSTAWDISSASYNTVFSVSAQDPAPAGLFFKPDGSKMYVAGSNLDNILEYDLSSAWSVSSASYNQLFDVSSQGTAPGGVFFKPDGTKMYVSDANFNKINEYDLSTAWDISSASYLQDFIVRQDIPQGVVLKTDGLKMYILGGVTDAVYEYDL